MTKDDKPTKFRPSLKGGQQPTSQGATPTKPPSNPPNQGTSGKK